MTLCGHFCPNNGRRQNSVERLTFEVVVAVAVVVAVVVNVATQKTGTSILSFMREEISFQSYFKK